jgi:hypothetical protein
MRQPKTKTGKNNKNSHEVVLDYTKIESPFQTGSRKKCFKFPSVTFVLKIMEKYG